MSGGGTLYLAATPLHSFLTLGLVAGPFRARGPHVFALIDQAPGARDYVADALEADPARRVEVRRFAAIGSLANPRDGLAAVRALAAERRPSTIAVGNDHRLEFYAAVQGCPDARRTYLDDGLYSYLPRPDTKAGWREALSNWRRRLKYGVPAERPGMTGGSRAVQDAYVLLPSQVHAGLAGKPVLAYERAWFADPWVQAICRGAAVAAGFDAARCAEIRLLLLLPHPSFLRAAPALRERFEALAADTAARGGRVAAKSHPNAGGTPVHAQLRLPEDAAIDVPARLPVEVLAPLLPAAGTLVVGTLTTALLSLVRLGPALTVRSIAPRLPGAGRGYGERAQAIYDAVGIRPLDDSDGPADAAPAPGP